MGWSWRGESWKERLERVGCKEVAERIFVVREEFCIYIYIYCVGGYMNGIV